MSSKSLGKTAIVLAAIALLGKVFGFVRELLLANYFGTDSVIDIYIMSITIPTILFGFLPALGIGYTPLFFEIQGEKKKNSFTNNVLCLSILFALLCVSLTYVFSEEIVHIVASGFSAGALAQTVSFLKVTIWLVVFNTPIQILMSFLNCNQSYLFSNVTNLVLSLVQSLFVIFAAQFDIRFLPYGILVSYIVQFAMLLILSANHGYRPEFRIKGDENIKKLLSLTMPIFISNMLVDINGFVDKYLASSLQEGSISALNYAFTLRSVVYYMCTSAITTIFYPKISEMIVEHRQKELAPLVTRVLNVLGGLFIPLTAGGVLLARPGIELVLMRGNFNEQSLELTVYPFVMYMLSLTFISARDVVVKILYASGDTKTNLIYGGICILVNIAVSLFLIKSLGHVGLALGTSLSAIFVFPLYMRKLKEMIEEIKFGRLIRNMVKIVFASIVMCIIIGMMERVCGNIIGSSTLALLLRLLLEILVAIIVYLTIARKIKVAEIEYLMNDILGVFKKKRKS